jgi:hypothetical protein
VVAIRMQVVAAAAAVGSCWVGLVATGGRPLLLLCSSAMQQSWGMLTRMRMQLLMPVAVVEMRVQGEAVRTVLALHQS